MKKIILTLFITTFLSNYYSQCSSLQPIQLPFFDDFESYSDTLSGIDTLSCSSNYRWTFESSTSFGRALCGVGSPVNNGGNGAITFDVNSFGTFNTNEFILTLNLSNYSTSDPIYLSFDCNNIADEPNIEDRIFIRGNENDSWIEVFDWSVLAHNLWVSKEETIQVSTTLNNNSQNYSSSFQVKFSQRDNYGYSSDGFAIDNVKLSVVTCPKPHDLTLNTQVEDSIFLSWTPTGNETSWIIEYGEKNFAIGQGVSFSTQTTLDTITNLNQGGVYDIYVKSICSSSNKSSWLGPLTVYSSVNNDSSCNAILVDPDGSNHQTNNLNTTTQFGASFYLGNTPQNTIWFKTTVPQSGHLAIETCSSEINTEIGVYDSPIDCSNLSTFNTLAIASFSSSSTNNVCGAPGKSAVELCGLTPGSEIYFWIGSYIASQEGLINFSVFDYSLSNKAGQPITDTVQVCVIDTLSLFHNLTNYDISTLGEWNYTVNQNAILNDSLISIGAMSYNYSNVDYIVSNTCDSDTATYTLNIHSANHAGEPVNNFENCNTNSIYLFDGLTGLIQTNGSWYNGIELLNSSSINSEAMTEGDYLFSYIVSDNICPADTSLVTLSILDCTDINEEDKQLKLYPNPNNGSFYISTSLNNYSVSIYNLNGKRILLKENLLNTQTYKIEIPNRNSGLFILKTESKEGVFIKKITKL